jgi:hypothetical protein
MLPPGYGATRAPSVSPVIATPEIGVPPLAVPDTDPHPIAEDVQIDGAQLQEDLVRALGRDVAISVISSDGPRSLTIADPATGLPLHADRKLVARVLGRHEPAETNQVRFLREFDAAGGVEGKLDAVRDFIARQVAEEDRGRFLRQRAQERATTPRVAMPVYGGPARPPVPPRVTSRNPWTQRAQRAQRGEV